MALTELQLPNKTTFYVALQNVATNLKHQLSELGYTADFLDTMVTADLNDMEIPVGAIRSDLIDFSTAISELRDFFDGTATTQTVVPKTIIDKVRRMVK